MTEESLFEIPYIQRKTYHLYCFRTCREIIYSQLKFLFRVCLHLYCARGIHLAVVFFTVPKFMLRPNVGALYTVPSSSYAFQSSKLK